MHVIKCILRNSVEPKLKRLQVPVKFSKKSLSTMDFDIREWFSSEDQLPTMIYAACYITLLFIMGILTSVRNMKRELESKKSEMGLGERLHHLNDSDKTKMGRGHHALRQESADVGSLSMASYQSNTVHSLDLSAFSSGNSSDYDTNDHDHDDNDAPRPAKHERVGTLFDSVDFAASKHQHVLVFDPNSGTHTPVTPGSPDNEHIDHSLRFHSMEQTVTTETRKVEPVIAKNIKRQKSKKNTTMRSHTSRLTCGECLSIVFKPRFLLVCCKDTFIQRGIYGTVLVYAFDIMTDINVMIFWFESNDFLYAYLSLGIVLIYRVVSSFSVHKAISRQTSKIKRFLFALVQFFDFYIFYEVFASIVVQHKSDRLLWINAMEASLEAAPQIVLQTVYLIQQSQKQDTNNNNGNNDSFLVVLGLFFSVWKLGATVIGADKVVRQFSMLQLNNIIYLFSCSLLMFASVVLYK